uniref:Uncharacterized protein n=1 Tax=Bradyrhizobium elkanii TaxID=29448 RepID=C4PL69_BRAEL|nr:hypothetical protein [Bradyrhizobium elkanii]
MLPLDRPPHISAVCRRKLQITGLVQDLAYVALDQASRCSSKRSVDKRNVSAGRIKRA